MSARHRVVVIGGGIGGLTAATRLAARGFSVDLFEQHPTLGGKMSRRTFDGCTFDTGPSLLTMPFVFESFFSSVGTSLAQELTLTRIDPQCRYHWSDGSTLNAHDSIDALSASISAIDAADGLAVRSYLAQAARVYEATKDVFIFNDFAGVGEFFKRRNLPLLRHLRAMRFTQRLHDLHASTFCDPRIVQLFDRFATYNGSSPYLAPATLMVIPHVEFAFGAWYPMGGMYTVAEAYERVARRHGVRIHCSTGVQRILHRDRRVTGVALADGTIVEADHVISNCDEYLTRTMLLDEPRTAPTDRSCSGYVMMMSVDAAGHALKHHNVFFSDNYRREFDDIFSKRVHPTDMTIYLSRSSHTDPSQAVAGRENWFLLMNAPATSEPPPERYADQVLTRLRTFGIDSHVRQMEIMTPSDIERNTMSFHGALYGSSSNSMFSAFLRPRIRSTRVRNLWYVGGSAHPGGGVPLVTISGMLASDLISTSTPL
ncbi:MAG: phytoene desaturase [Bacteroidetes bacterium]|nr:phytoene desaturase [Bacteroidota bacterium]